MSIFIRKSDSVQCTEKVFACLEILKIVSFVFYIFSPESVWLMSVAVKVTSSGSGLNVRNLQEFQLKKRFANEENRFYIKSEKKIVHSFPNKTK